MLKVTADFPGGRSVIATAGRYRGTTARSFPFFFFFKTRSIHDRHSRTRTRANMQRGQTGKLHGFLILHAVFQCMRRTRRTARLLDAAKNETPVREPSAGAFTRCNGISTRAIRPSDFDEPHSLGNVDHAYRAENDRRRQRQRERRGGGRGGKKRATMK